MSHTVIYKQTKAKDITKDGHTMFTGDIVMDLNRKSYLEVNKIELEEEKKALIEYVKHEESCKCIEDNTRHDESSCDCGLYELIKNNIRH